MTPQRLITWQFELMATALAASTTIAIRSLNLMNSTAAGKLPERRETTRMVTEKAQAFSAGASVAMLEWNRLWWRAAMAGSMAPFGFTTAWLDVIRAASRPAGKNGAPQLAAPDSQG